MDIHIPSVLQSTVGIQFQLISLNNEQWDSTEWENYKRATELACFGWWQKHQDLLKSNGHEAPNVSLQHLPNRIFTPTNNYWVTFKTPHRWEDRWHCEETNRSGSFLEVRQPERQDDQSAPLIANVNNKWTHISTPPACPNIPDRGNFTFLHFWAFKQAFH